MGLTAIPNLKLGLKGERFASIEDIKVYVIAYLKPSQ